MHILAIHLDESAVGHYRTIQPFTKLMEHGLAKVHLFNNKEYGLDHARLAECIAASDIIHIPHPNTEKWLDILDVCRKYGKLVVLDFDDDIFNLSPWNPYYKWIGIKEYAYEWEDKEMVWLWRDKMLSKDGSKELFNIEKNMRTRDTIRMLCGKADALSVTTSILKRSMSSHNKTVFELPNLIDLNLFRKLPLIKDDYIRIVWQGGHSHYEDLWEVKDALKGILLNNKNVRLSLFGTYFEGIFKDFPQDQIEYSSWVQHKAYPYKLPTLNGDIGIAPLSNTTFNKNKSCIKYLEYGAVGMPTVASDVSPYKEVIDNERTGFLVGHSSEWSYRLQQLIDNVELRKKMADRAYEDIHENWNADKYAHKWLEVYDAVLTGKHNKVTV